MVCKLCGTSNDNFPSVIVSSSSGGSCFPNHEEGGDANLRANVDSTISGGVSLSLRSDVTSLPRPDDPDATYKVEFNPDTEVALKLNRVHTLTQCTDITYAAFSVDGKYLAAASNDCVYTFDVKTGKRLR